MVRSSGDVGSTFGRDSDGFVRLTGFQERRLKKRRKIYIFIFFWLETILYILYSTTYIIVCSLLENPLPTTRKSR